MDSLQKKDFQWLGTLTHELTHLLDFIQYAKLNNLDSYDVIQRDMKHRPFMLWTECNARAKGYFFIRKYVFGDKVNDKYDTDQTDYILQTELPYQINVFAKNNKITHLYVESSKTAATVIVFESLCDLILTSLFFVGSIYLFLVNQQLSMGMVIFFAIYLLMKIISFIEAEYKKTLKWVEYFRKKGSGYYYAEEKREIKLEDVVIYKSRLYTVIYQKNEWWLSQKGKKIILDSELVSLDDIMGKTPEDIRLYYY